MASSPTLDGRWVNTDPQTQHLVELVIDSAAATFHGFGACVPTSCDWGAAQASFNGSSLTVTYNFGFATASIRATESAGVLTVETFTDFIDTDRRADFSTIETFRRAAG